MSADEALPHADVDTTIRTQSYTEDFIALSELDSSAAVENKQSTAPSHKDEAGATEAAADAHPDPQKEKGGAPEDETVITAAVKLETETEPPSSSAPREAAGEDERGTPSASGAGPDPELERMMTVEIKTDEEGNQRIVFKSEEDARDEPAAPGPSKGPQAQGSAPSPPPNDRTTPAKPASAKKKKKAAPAKIPDDYLTYSPVPLDKPMTFVRPASGNDGHKLHLRTRPPEDPTMPDFSSVKPRVESTWDTKSKRPVSRGAEHHSPPRASHADRPFTADYDRRTGRPSTRFMTKEEIRASVDRLSKPSWYEKAVITSRPVTAPTKPGVEGPENFGQTFYPRLYSGNVKKLSSEELDAMVGRLYKVKEPVKLGQWNAKRVKFRYDPTTSRMVEVLVPLKKKTPEQYTEDILARYAESQKKSEAIQQELAEKYLKPIGPQKVYKSKEEKEALLRKVEKLYQGGRTVDVDLDS